MKKALLIITILMLISSVVIAANPMYLWLWDSVSNTRPPGATGSPPILGDTAPSNWYIMCMEGLNARCLYPFTECSNTFGSCPGCDGDVHCMDGIYGDLLLADGVTPGADGVGDLSGWVTAPGIVCYVCEGPNGITTGGKSPWYTP